MGGALVTLRAGAALPAPEVAALRRHLVFRCFKLDPQYEDHPAVAPYPLWLDRAAWDTLRARSEQLAAETVALEAAALRQPALWAALGLGARLRLALRAAAPSPAARVMRFDWHWCEDGWRVSEVNSDVPGGYIEAAGLGAWMADRCGGALPGDPAAAVADALAAAAPAGHVALVHATAYTDDRQVMQFLARYLAARGLRTTLASPLDVTWTDGRAAIGDDAVDAVARFFPAEWLVSLPLSARWWRWFGPCRTPSSNPTTASLTQSKRLPLLWDRLGVPVPGWRAALPTTRAPSAWRADGTQVLKPAWGRVGADVTIPGLTPANEQRTAERYARLFPRAWVAQDRFRSVPVDGPAGPVHAVLGVYTVDGRAAGVYGRVAPTSLINSRAQDVAVLLPEEGP
jgi:glutathionylspermidine synthase